MEYRLHRILRDFQLMYHNLLASHGLRQWTAWFTLIFAVAFLVVGILRIVEFEGLDLPPTRKTVLIVLHILGCVVFSGMFALFALDLEKTHTQLIGALLVSALLLLFPVHIYVGLLRRVRSPSILRN